jgi:hypothetical protein
LISPLFLISSFRSCFFEDFIHHRLKHIIDEPKRRLALDLAKRVAEIDGVVDCKEKHALTLLRAEVA